MANLNIFLLLSAWVTAVMAHMEMARPNNLAHPRALKHGGLGGAFHHVPRDSKRTGLGGAFHEVDVESNTEKRVRDTADDDQPWCILVSRILTVAPNTDSCDGAAYPDECRTASQAGPSIYASWSKYNIDSMATRAALVSLMLYESGEFKYNWGHFVSGQTVHTPGKGTRNMQSATYNEEYATALYGADKVAQAKASGGDDGVLTLVSGDEDSFGSAAWFLTSQCTETVQQGVASGTQDGFEAYITGCIGGTMDDSRLDYWNKAKSAWGV